jgi:hypothetical protein
MATQTPQQCRTCLANGHPNQMIIFEQLPGMFKPDGKPKFKPVAPDGSKHEHKMMQANVPGTTLGSIPTINMSESQKQSIHDDNNSDEEWKEGRITKDEYNRRKEEKYDRNIEQYKQWQSDILDVGKKTLEAIENLNISIQAFLHRDEEKPTIQKASELKASSYEQDKAWSGLDQTIQDLGLSEDRPSQEENKDENPEREERGYPE